MLKSDDKFIEQLMGYYRGNARKMPWRTTTDPYKILVSEFMLQQTQVVRVIPKYQEFLQYFPNIYELAATELGDVLKVWSGLGYNRRAKYLWESARILVSTHNGEVPASMESLVKLPGIGKNTAAAIIVYAYNTPQIFIETNIRTVYLYHYYPNAVEVEDFQILDILQRTIDKNNPREFYWALMDYGTYIKSVQGNHNHRSKQYKKQSKFLGSRRQLRGKIIEQLTKSNRTDVELSKCIADDRLQEVLTDLTSEGLIKKIKNTYSLY